MLIISGTREHTLFAYALEEYVIKAKQRGGDIKEFIDNTPIKKIKQALDGYTFVYVNIGIDSTSRN